MFGSLFFSAIRFEDSESRNEFRPLPLLSNPHLQTLLGHWLSGPAFAYPSRSEIVPLPDGDCLVLHDSAPENWRDGESIVVLVHGLTGSHASAVVQRTANLLLPEGLRVVRVDLRGTGASLPLSRGTYHGGCSQDLRVGLEAVHRWSPQSPIILVGFSLGGNIVLKLGGGRPIIPFLAWLASLPWRRPWILSAAVLYCRSRKTGSMNSFSCAT